MGEPLPHLSHNTYPLPTLDGYQQHYQPVMATTFMDAPSPPSSNTFPQATLSHQSLSDRPSHHEGLALSITDDARYPIHPNQPSIIFSTTASSPSPLDHVPSTSLPSPPVSGRPEFAMEHSNSSTSTQHHHHQHPILYAGPISDSNLRNAYHLNVDAQPQPKAPKSLSPESVPFFKTEHVATSVLAPPQQQPNDPPPSPNSSSHLPVYMPIMMDNAAATGNNNAPSPASPTSASTTSTPLISPSVPSSSSSIPQQMSSNVVRQTYTVAHKLEVVNYAMSHGRNKAADHFKLSRPMVGRWVKARSRLAAAHEESATVKRLKFRTASDAPAAAGAAAVGADGERGKGPGFNISDIYKVDSGVKKDGNASVIATAPPASAAAAATKKRAAPRKDSKKFMDVDHAEIKDSKKAEVGSVSMPLIKPKPGPPSGKPKRKRTVDEMMNDGGDVAKVQSSKPELVTQVHSLNSVLVSPSSLVPPPTVTYSTSLDPSFAPYSASSPSTMQSPWALSMVDQDPSNMQTTPTSQYSPYPIQDQSPHQTTNPYVPFLPSSPNVYIAPKQDYPMQPPQPNYVNILPPLNEPQSSYHHHHQQPQQPQQQYHPHLQHQPMHQPSPTSAYPPFQPQLHQNTYDPLPHRHHPTYMTHETLDSSSGSVTPAMSSSSLSISDGRTVSGSGRMLDSSSVVFVPSSSTESVSSNTANSNSSYSNAYPIRQYQPSNQQPSYYYSPPVADVMGGSNGTNSNAGGDQFGMRHSNGWGFQGSSHDNGGFQGPAHDNGAAHVSDNMQKEMETEIRRKNLRAPRHDNGFFSSDEDEDTFFVKLGVGKRTKSPHHRPKPHSSSSRSPSPTSSISSNSDTLIPTQEASRIGTQVHYDFPGLPRPIRIAEDSSGGCGGKTWEAAGVLSSHLVHRGKEYLKKKKIVELGAGTGVVGILVGMMLEEVPAEERGEVVITDMLFLDLMRKNVELNLDEKARKCVMVDHLKWGEPIPSSCQRCDLILASDCVYLEAAFDPLIQTLKELSGPNTEALIVSKRRRKADKRFFVKLRKHFQVEEVSDDPNYANFSKDGLSILKATIRPLRSVAKANSNSTTA
ncbi:hypothetical protein HDU97_006324 [Phlyctochytrium planicorne]|nr:hypothetical protein HDU97_006324 [Phlyctochytrium planicorne]